MILASIIAAHDKQRIAETEGDCETHAGAGDHVRRAATVLAAYPGAVLKSAPHPAAARLFMDPVLSAGGPAILQK